MTRTFRWKLALVLVGCILVGGLAVQATHTLQVRRHATAWLGQARQARAQDQTPRALQYYSLYLTHQPNDHDARAEQGLLLDAAAKSVKARRQAAEVLRNVLAHRPERHDVRARLVAAEMALGNFASARPHLALLLAAFPQSVAYEELQGRCLEAGGEFEQAAAAYERALEHDPKAVPVYVRLASVLHERLEDVGQAHKVLDRMVAANEQAVAARLARARFLMRLGDSAAAHQDVTAARRLGRHDSEVLLLATQLAAPSDRSDLGHDLQEALKVHSRDAGLYRALAQLEWQAGRHDEAEACLRRGLQALGNQPDLLNFLCEILVRRQALTEARMLSVTLRQAGDALGSTYWEAQILMVERRWLDAGRALESARGRPEAWGWMPRLELALAECYAHMGNQERRIEACRRAVAGSPAARLALAEALRGAGRTADAQTEYHQVVRQAQAPLEAWLGLARTLLARNQQLPPERRSWNEIDDALERAAAQAPHTLAVALLHSEILAAKGQYAEAAAVLEQTRARDPRPPEVWLALAELAERQGRSAAALQLLTEGQRHVRATLPLQLARLRLVARRGGRIGAAVRELEKGLTGLPPHEQSAACLALAEACRHSRELELAERLATQAAAGAPEDLRSRLVLLELCLESNQEEKHQRVLAQVRAIEGDGGTYWRAAAAARCIRIGDPAALELSREHLAVVQQRRPQWPRLHVLLGQLDERQGRTDRACNSYLRAVELGERSPELCLRLLEQLHQRERDTEASYVVRVLEENGTLDGAALVLAAENALATGQSDRAVDWARRAAARPEAGAQVWLAGILTSAGQAEEAEKVLRSATQRWPDVPGAWAALVRHLAKQDRGQAEAILRDAKGDLVLAACHEALGEPERAAERLRTALKQTSVGIDAHVQAAAFYLRQQRPAEATPHLQRVGNMDSNPAIASWARRELALIVAAGGSDAQRQQALGLLALNEKDKVDPVADQRARARILAAREATLAEAIRLLEASAGWQPLPAEERHLLAKLYRKTGDRAKARDLLARLAAGRGQQPRFVAEYIDMLLGEKELAEASRWLAILERLEPASPTVAKLKHELTRLSSMLE